MVRPAAWFAVLPATALVASPAYATVYLTVERAQQVMFPAASSFAERSIELSKAQQAAVRRAAGFSAPKTLRIWEVSKGQQRIGWFVVDRVLGKHEYITYAVALSPTGQVRSIEILEYRETYGGEIRNENWRRQFVGKDADSDLKLGRDIKNISGATLSCQHVTKGVKRILAAFDQLLLKS